MADLRTVLLDSFKREYHIGYAFWSEQKTIIIFSFQRNAIRNLEHSVLQFFQLNLQGAILTK